MSELSPDLQAIIDELKAIRSDPVRSAKFDRKMEKKWRNAAGPAIDAFYEGTKDAPFNASVEAAWNAMLAVASEPISSPKAPDDGKGQPVAWLINARMNKPYIVTVPWVTTHKGEMELYVGKASITPLYPHTVPHGWQQGAALQRYYHVQHDHDYDECEFQEDDTGEWVKWSDVEALLRPQEGK
jgi:hypothetical protein